MSVCGKGSTLPLGHAAEEVPIVQETSDPILPAAKEVCINETISGNPLDFLTYDPVLHRAFALIGLGLYVCNLVEHNMSRVQITDFCPLQM